MINKTNLVVGLLMISGVLLFSGCSGDFLSLTSALEKSSLPDYIKMTVLICATLVFIVGFLAIFTSFFNNISSRRCQHCDSDDQDDEGDNQDADIKIN